MNKNLLSAKVILPHYSAIGNGLFRLTVSMAKWVQMSVFLMKVVC